MRIFSKCKDGKNEKRRTASDILKNDWLKLLQFWLKESNRAYNGTWIGEIGMFFFWEEIIANKKHNQINNRKLETSENVTMNFE